jgi:hypothetical protein
LRIAWAIAEVSLLQGDQRLAGLTLAVGRGDGALDAAQHDRQSGDLLTQVIVQVACEARTLEFLRVDQPADEVLVLFRDHPVARLALAQGGFDPAPPDALHDQARDEGRLKQHDAHRRNDVVLVLLPYAGLPEPDGAAGGHARFVDAPVLQGPPVKHRHRRTHGKGTMGRRIPGNTEGELGKLPRLAVHVDDDSADRSRSDELIRADKDRHRSRLNDFGCRFGIRRDLAMSADQLPDDDRDRVDRQSPDPRQQSIERQVAKRNDRTALRCGGDLLQGLLVHSAVRFRGAVNEGDLSRARQQRQRERDRLAVRHT